MDKAILQAHGIDYAQGIARCMQDEEIYRYLLSMFLEDDTFARTKSAYEKRDKKTLFLCAHELKGACGNASMTDLYTATCAMVEYLRAGNSDDGEIDKLYSAMEIAYDKAKTGVELALAK